MKFDKLKFDDDAVYAKKVNGKFHFEDWMFGFSTHENQKETITRYEFCKKNGIDRYAEGCEVFDLYNVLTGHNYSEWKHQSLYDELNQDFDHYECLDHSIVYKNSKTRKTWVMSLVYVDKREKIKKSCEKWGFDVEFIPYRNENDYSWMYVIYSKKA